MGKLIDDINIDVVMSVLDVNDLPKQLLQHEDGDVDEQVELVVEDTGNVLGEEVIEYEEWPGPLHDHEYHPSEQIIVEPYVDEHGIIYEPEYEEWVLYIIVFFRILINVLCYRYVDESSPVVETSSVAGQHIDNSALLPSGNFFIIVYVCKLKLLVRVRCRLTTLILASMTNEVHPFVDQSDLLIEENYVLKMVYYRNLFWFTLLLIYRMDDVIDSVIAGVPLLKRKSPQNRAAIIAQCQICGLMLKHPSKIQAHMRTHTGEKPFECGTCGMRFATPSPLRIHIKRKHSKDRPFPCTWECGMNFVSIGARNEHEKIVHAGIKRYECTAPGCRRMFTRRRYLMMHRAKDHPGIYAPIFDPEEIAQAEMEADVEILAERETENALHNYTELTQQVLVDPSTNRIVHITTDGVVLEPENEHHFLEGEFIDDNDDTTADECFQYVEDDAGSRYVSVVDESEPVENIVDVQDHMDIHSSDSSDSLKSHVNCDSPKSKPQEPSETLEEVDRKKIWIKGLGDFDPPQMKTVRILKRKVPVRRSD
uniref:C2H2-type domain-containing protein n=1 Tax=Heterorhabditis bacteriophora TaxID=37862 RepID=A0A1I7X1Y7_HETBA